ncbi:unnamed protein product [Ceutorhynchus assimilis]|uniref:NudC domain-containing protein 1 n=1 Tax=Ceutorhynchus assimilis TaxID=467358 RepID=A0A9N9MXB2_9CUCU|nr:unnamed protein product [Ceutorhynchus assimilis]
MSLKTLELKPDRLLMDSNFEGYKLSLEELESSHKNLETPVDKTHLNSSQYGLLHAKLFGLHNHLIGDKYDNYSSVYYVDQQFNIRKTYVDSLSNELVDPVSVFVIPKVRERAPGDYNVTLKFASGTIAVASDGMGLLYILDTKDKRDDDEFTTVFSGKVLNDEDQGFIISDALYNDISKELHVLLLHIQENTVDRFVSIIHWITFKEDENSSWNQVAIRQLKTKGEVQYLHLEKNCQHIYVASENAISFVLNSEHPVQMKTEKVAEKIYNWSQTLEEISIKVSLPENAHKNLVKVTCDQSKIDVSYNSKSLTSGELENHIDPSLLTWTLNNDILEIILTKSTQGVFWKELIKGDDVLETCIVEPFNQRLQRRTSDTEVLPQTGTTFNSQQIEECDFETDKSETFERISGVTNEATHRIHLGSHQVLLSPYLNSDLPPALGIRHDIDLCLWQPVLDNDFSCKHVGTLHAFGYVQASKTNRKFLMCSPNLDYAVISESVGHIFIYRQNIPLLADLRQRSTGVRVKNIAKQHVFNLPNKHILGIFAGNKHLFILGEDFVIALSIAGTQS